MEATPGIKQTPIMSPTGALQFIFGLMFPLTGILIAYIGFCDPDTCWHLALGRWIDQNHSLPYFDPFSSNLHDFVYVAPNLPLIQHEWLSDALFYQLFLAGGTILLLAAACACAVTSLLLIPAYLMKRNFVPKNIIFAFAISIASASAFRLWVRPEQLSFLFMSVLILINDLYQSEKGRNWKAIACPLAVLLLISCWSNAHALWVVGLFFLVGYYSLAFIESLWLGKTGKVFICATSLISLALCGSLNTPWHFQYWHYLIKLISSPLATVNRENGAMTWQGVHSLILIPFFVALSLFWFSTLISLVRQVRRKASIANFILPLGLGIAATVVSFAFLRLMPFALLVLCLALSISYRRTLTGDLKASPLTSAIDSPKRFCAQALAAVTASVLGCLVASTFLVSPTVPSESWLFSPPQRAISFIEQAKLPGRMLNDSRYGSMMIWTMIQPPDIFIDGRFDSYDRQLVSDYSHMRSCTGNWKKLMDKYNIGWVFFPKTSPIISQLATTPGWSQCYSDDDAVILERSATR